MILHYRDALWAVCASQESTAGGDEVPVCSSYALKSSFKGYYGDGSLGFNSDTVQYNTGGLCQSLSSHSQRNISCLLCVVGYENIILIRQLQTD